MLERRTRKEISDVRTRERHRARERDRRYRKRLAAGVVTVAVEVDAVVLNFLIATRWLDESEAGDKARIAEAIAAMLKGAAR